MLTAATAMDNLNHLAAAANHIKAAIAEFEKVNMTTDDAFYYAYKLRELLSCDHGESGLDHLIKILEAKNAR